MTENQTNQHSPWLGMPQPAGKPPLPGSLILLWILAGATILCGVILTAQDSGLLGTYLLSGGFLALLAATSTQAVVTALRQR